MPIPTSRIKQKVVQDASEEENLEQAVVCASGQGDNTNPAQGHANPIFAFPSWQIEP